MALVASLEANSETAQDIAAAFLKFQEPVAESATEITGLVAELFAISSALLELGHAQREPSNRRWANVVSEDQYTVLGSLEATFRDVNRFFGHLGWTKYQSNRAAFVKVWQDIDDFFYDEGNNTLLRRLQYYTLFLQDLSSIVQGYRPSPGFEDLGRRIERLLHVQDTKMEGDLDKLTLGTRQRSWERVRPYGLPTAARPNAGRGMPEPRSPLSPDFGGNGFPFAPEVPDSPTISATIATSSTSSNSASSSPDHWLTTVFSQARPSTHFTQTGPESRFVGEKMPGAAKALAKDYSHLEQLPFENGNLNVHFYIRPSDRRARLLITQLDRSIRQEASYPLTGLRIDRVQTSCLRIRITIHRNTLTLWAILCFSSYERLVLFFGAFLALKAQDEKLRLKRLEDHVLADELLLFTGLIIDDMYEHKLTILKDRDSGGVRLQASVRSQELKNCPVWTAFITYLLPGRKWMKLYEPRKVHLTELTRFVLSCDYTPRTASGGEHELYFVDAEGAKLFIKTIENIADDVL